MTINLPCTPTRWQMLIIRLIRLLARVGRFRVEERTGADWRMPGDEGYNKFTDHLYWRGIKRERRDE